MPVDLLRAARDEVADAARIADEAVPAVPADADAVARLPRRDARADAFHHCGDLVPGDAGQREAGEVSILHESGRCGRDRRRGRGGAPWPRAGLGDIGGDERQ